MSLEGVDQLKQKESGDKTITFRCPPELREKLVALGEKEDRPLGWIIRKALESFVELKNKNRE